MNGFIIFGIVVISIIFLIVGIKQLMYLSRKVEYRDWEIGDEIQSIVYNQMHEKIVRTYIIDAWSKKEIIYHTNDSTQRYSLTWFDFNKNLSANRRRIYNRCKHDMGKNPGFAPLQQMVVNSKTSSIINAYNDGKDLSLWSETECQVYLKQALDAENYEFAEKIKKEMERFR